nr:hypothetical protein [Tanacetum cinerariifolium]
FMGRMPVTSRLDPVSMMLTALRARPIVAGGVHVVVRNEAPQVVLRPAAHAPHVQFREDILGADGSVGGGKIVEVVGGKLVAAAVDNLAPGCVLSGPVHGGIGQGGQDGIYLTDNVVERHGAFAHAGVVDYQLTGVAVGHLVVEVEGPVDGEGAQKAGLGLLLRASPKLRSQHVGSRENDATQVGKGIAHFRMVGIPVVQVQRPPLAVVVPVAGASGHQALIGGYFGKGKHLGSPLKRAPHGIIDTIEQRRRIARRNLVRGSNGWELQREVDAEREGAGRRVAGVVDTGRGHHPRRLICIHLGVEAAVIGDNEQVLANGVDARALEYLAQVAEGIGKRHVGELYKIAAFEEACGRRYGVGQRLLGAFLELVERDVFTSPNLAHVEHAVEGVVVDFIAEHPVEVGN